MSGVYDREKLVDVLVHHAQTRTSGCSCGGVKLGGSYPEHVADTYERSGPTKDQDPPRAGR